MGKPSLKTTSFKHHPVYVQKALHVDNPFYGPKPEYQRAEIVPGGDCQVVTNTFLEQTTGQLDVALESDGGRSGVAGDHCIRLTQTAHDSKTAVYLRFLDSASQPIHIDLQYARFVGMWIKAGTGDVFDAGDLTFYIYTKKSNYLYANAAMYIDFIDYTDAGNNVWRYIELDLARFTRNTGYEGVKLDEVWGIGWYSEDVPVGNTLDIDQIEFYTVGTGLGPARGLIMSAPLKDGIHAQRGYGLRWDPNSGRIDTSDANDHAFAGICVGNPSETRLTHDFDISDTTIIVLDASLFEIGSAHIWDDGTLAGETVDISAVNTVTNTLTVTAILVAYEVADNAKIAMMGNEKGTIRVDFMVSGIVNLEAAEDIALGLGCTCATAGAALTVNKATATEQGQIIGKTVIAAANAEEQFPVKLTTDARTA